MRRRRQSNVALLFVLSGLVLTGCSSGDPAPLTADSSIFAGLPRDVAVEALASPTRRTGPDDTVAWRGSVAQAAVREFVMCRDMYRVYRGWVTTGQAPVPRPLAMPTKPLEPGNEHVVNSYAEFVDVVKSGEPKQLKEIMTATRGCGSDVPVKPSDLSGPTIADAVKDL